MKVVSGGWRSGGRRHGSKEEEAEKSRGATGGRGTAAVQGSDGRRAAVEGWARWLSGFVSEGEEVVNFLGTLIQRTDGDSGSQSPSGSESDISGKRKRCDGPFSFPRQKRSTRRRVHQASSSSILSK
ncbi:hypothetical protein KSS87_021390 [Heliosperma pusillum]|nr:hypothetical protein KSS87_021390 [Heliosperma pusillum]